MRRYHDADLFVKHLLLFPLYLVSRAIPRSRRVAFGSSQHGFTGNPKYLLLHLREHAPDLDVAWIAPTRALRDQVRARGHRAYWKYEPRGLWFCLTARVYVFGGRPADINYWTSGGAVLVNLWHGVGLKAIGFDSTSSENRMEFNPRSLYRRIVKPWLYSRPNVFVSTTRLLTAHYAKAFRIPESQCLEVGYPRSDHFFLSDQDRHTHLAKCEPPDALAFVRTLQRYRRVVLYMPTYRETREDFLTASGIDFAALDAQMREQDSLFVFKLHPWTDLTLPPQGRYPNLLFADATADMYPYFPYVDLLVTDYSSVYFDFLLLKRAAVLFVFDRQRYESESRDLILDFDTYTPGPRVTTFQGLLDALRSNHIPFGPEHERVRALFWGDYSGNASEAVLSKLRQLLA